MTRGLFFWWSAIFIRQTPHWPLAARPTQLGLVDQHAQHAGEQLQCREPIMLLDAQGDVLRRAADDVSDQRRLYTSGSTVFETRVRRTTYPVKHDDSEIEVSLDRGQIIANGRSRPCMR
jgi:hypothetical protein